MLLTSLKSFTKQIKFQTQASAPAFHIGCGFHERSSRFHMLEAGGNAGKHAEKNTGKERNNEVHID